LTEGKDATAYLTAEDLAGVDDGAIDKLCAEAIANNARAVNDYRNGKSQAIKALVGYVMKATRGKADAATVEQKLVALIGG
ncbi:MAG: Asp-tRNA(Asn)/Glu-tRNA(Gln) amidotransferase GatCAB subunit B, partial [Firmicutes bacterium]|nr:Asp-tRNA(Asn)/Glu-tRNA(Gln) amidotransferase GatCAB subunit B [Candidatus Stercoripulliclostridium pullicola]